MKWGLLEVKMGKKFSNPVKGSQKEIKKESPWNFEQPCYDERSSWFLNAGTDYGIGHTNPVGHSGTTKQRVPTLPFGKHEAEFERPRQYLSAEVEE